MSGNHALISRFGMNSLCHQAMKRIGIVHRPESSLSSFLRFVGRRLKDGRGNLCDFVVIHELRKLLTSRILGTNLMTHLVASLALSLVAQASPQGLYSPQVAPSGQQAAAPTKLAPASSPVKVLPAAQAPGKLAPAAAPAKAMPSGQAANVAKIAPTAQGPAKLLPAAQAPGKMAPAAAPAKAMPSGQGGNVAKIAPTAQGPAKLLPAAQAPGKMAPAVAPAKAMPSGQGGNVAKIAPTAQGPAKLMPAAQAPGKMAPAAAPAKAMPSGQGGHAKHSPFGPAKTLPSAQSALKSIYGGHSGHQHKAVAPSAQGKIYPSSQSVEKTGLLHRLFH
jgi:hypothetical protein